MSFNSGNKNVNDMIIASKNNRKNAKDFLKWIESSRLKVLHELDRGAFGVVHKARWYKRNYTDTVAVKFFHDDREFLREFTNIHRMIKRCSSEDDTISEKNLVHYYGATYDYDNEEYDLVHGDLHSGNIMIDDDKDDPNIAWIGDLGFCREEENEKKYDGFRGVMAFMAPEILKELPPNACTLYNKFCDWIDDDERFEDVKWDTIKPVKKSDYHRETNYMSQTWIF
ncbi:unnamed protein product [Rhizophagus irregularis]|nr:unnamed protein product [Rhizophagus irregularis]